MQCAQLIIVVNNAGSRPNSLKSLDDVGLARF